MSLAVRQHPVERLAEWLAPIPLALAVGWSGRTVGLPTAVAAAAAVAALLAGFSAVRLIGRDGIAWPHGFEPAAFDGEAHAMDELLLGPEDEVLILDDPLVEVAQDSRVVRLFAPQEPTPGELVDRIADFLGDNRRIDPQIGIPAEEARLVDASAALQAALANIRASLR